MAQEAATTCLRPKERSSGIERVERSSACFATIEWTASTVDASWSMAQKKADDRDVTVVVSESSYDTARLMKKINTDQPL